MCTCVRTYDKSTHSLLIHTRSPRNKKIHDTRRNTSHTYHTIHTLILLVVYYCYTTSTKPLQHYSISPRIQNCTPRRKTNDTPTTLGTPNGAPNGARRTHFSLVITLLVLAFLSIRGSTTQNVRLSSRPSWNQQKTRIRRPGNTLSHLTLDSTTPPYDHHTATASREHY